MPGKNLYTAKNGAKYTKNARGQVRFVSGASKEYLAKIRKKRGKGKKKAKAKGGGLLAKKIGRRWVEAGVKAGMTAVVGTGGRPRGGGLKLKRKGLGKIAVGAAGLGFGAYTGTLGSNASATIGYERQLAKGVRKAKGGFVNSKYLAPAQRKRRVRGAGLALHNKTTVKFKAKGVRSRTTLGF